MHTSYFGLKSTWKHFPKLLSQNYWWFDKSIFVSFIWLFANPIHCPIHSLQWCCWFWHNANREVTPANWMGTFSTYSANANTIFCLFLSLFISIFCSWNLKLYIYIFFFTYIHCNVFVFLFFWRAQFIFIVLKLFEQKYQKIKKGLF